MTEDTLLTALTGLEKRVDRLEESLPPKASAPTIASQSETRREEEAKHLEAMVDGLDAVIDGLRTDIARKDALIKVQAQTAKDQAEKIAEQNRTIDDLISDLRADRDVYADNLVRRLSAAHADNHRITGKLAQIHRALRYKGDVHPQEHLNQVRRAAGVPVRPTRRFR